MIGPQLVTMFGRNGYKNHVPVYDKNGELMGFIPWATIARGAAKIGGGIFKGIKKAVERKRAEKARAQETAAAQARAMQAAAQAQKAKIEKSKQAQAALMIGLPVVGLAAFMLMRK